MKIPYRIKLTFLGGLGFSIGGNGTGYEYIDNFGTRYQESA